MNKVILMGRLTRDPEVKYSQGEKSICIARFGLAVDRRFKREGSPDVDFFNCVSFGKQGEFVEKYLKKGVKITISGRIETGSYTDKDGIKRYTTDIVTEEIEFAESKAAAEKHQQETAKDTKPDTPSDDGFMNIPEGIEEELPFI